MALTHVVNELNTLDTIVTEKGEFYGDLDISVLPALLYELLCKHAWIITVLMLVFIASGIYRCYKTKKQDSDEKDIKNMFNEDGTKNQHYEHKDYDPFPTFAFAVLLLVVRLLLAAS